MKLGQFMYNYKIKPFIKKFYEKCDLKTFFLVYKGSRLDLNINEQKCNRHDP